MPVHLVAEPGAAGLVEADESEGDVTAIEENESVKAHGERGLVAPPDGLVAPDQASAARDEYALAIGGIEGGRRQTPGRVRETRLRAG